MLTIQANQNSIKRYLDNMDIGISNLTPYLWARKKKKKKTQAPET
jgi:hypothetical protein